FAQDLTNRDGANAWPITSTTFILVHKQQENAEKGKAVLDFFNWAYDKGGKQAEALDYAILPQEVVTAVRAAWKTEVKDSQGKALF
ncbi:phosphate ABC transporter substrate-binding protein PstS, partial [Providencia rettgeri]